MALNLTDLPFEILQHVLQLAASNTKTLLNCEITCKGLEKVVKDDKTWALVGPSTARRVARLARSKSQQPLPRSMFRSNREYASLMYSIGSCMHMQRAAQGNALFDSIVHGAFKQMVNRAVMSRLVNSHYDFIHFRHDTLYALAEILQASMIRLLSRAHSIACVICRDGEYPVLTVSNLRQETVDSHELVPNDLMALELATTVADIMSEHDRDMIVRRFARLAGIARMTNEACGLAWATFVNVMLRLVKPAVLQLTGSNTCGYGRRLLSMTPGNTFRSVPPLSMGIPCDDCGEVHMHYHTPVPQQIEDAAKSLGLPCKVYGDFWFDPSGPEGYSWYSWSKEEELPTGPGSLVAELRGDYVAEQEDYIFSGIDSDSSMEVDSSDLDDDSSDDEEDVDDDDISMVSIAY